MTTKETFSRNLPHLDIGISSQQGWRKTQEDSHIAVELDERTLLFGVFDGHGGEEVARFCSNRIHKEIVKLPEYDAKQFDESLVCVFHRMDELLRTKEGLEELKRIKRTAPGTMVKIL